MESARGRSFLQEFALRNRVADTTTLLTAIGRIEGLLTSRSLEPAGPSSTDSGPPPEAHAVEAVAAESTEIENSPPSELTETGVVSVEVFEVASGSAGVAARQVSAIEFLGPDLGTEPASLPAIPQNIPAKPEASAPFADIRALSYEEKIALFA